MIISKQKWLLTASPWMKNSLRLLPLAPVAIGGLILTALLVFTTQIGIAQVKSSSTISTSQLHASGTVINTSDMPAISGGNSVCIGSNTTLSNATTGGTWTSNNTSIATVSNGLNPGIVTGAAAGVATITYTVGSSYTYIIMTVMAPITGATTVCTGNITTLADASVAGNWTSANPGFATVSPTGVVTGVGAGVATISYTRPGCSVTYPVTVSLNGLSGITGTLSVCTGGVTALTDASGAGTWSSNNTSLATVDGSGNVTGVAAGTATITYANGGCYKTAPMAVSATAPSAITGSTALVCTGNLTTLADATTGGTWSSSNTSATVNTHGVVNGVAAGTATISYTKTGCSALYPITVNTNTLAAITGTTTVCVGGVTALTDASGAGTWASSNTGLASVDGSGNVTGASVGTPTITYANGGCYKTTSLTVNNTAPASISGTSNLCTGNIVAFTDATLGGTWSSSNTTLASVSATGIVTANAVGTPNITYTKLGCSSVLTLNISATPTPITGTLSVCNGLTTALADVATPGGTWSSSNTTNATISVGGLVTATDTGTSVISYTVGTCAATAIVTVNSPAPISGPNTVCSGSTSLYLPGTIIYLSEATYGGTWSKSNTSVSLSGSGTSVAIQGVAAGTTTVTYTQGGCYVTSTITINAGVSTISGNNEVCMGSTMVLTDASTGTWSSGNTSIATIDPSTGIITPVAPGSVGMYFTNASGCAANTTILVDAAMATPITGTTFTVCTGLATINLANATPGGSWSSSNPMLATVNGAGVVTGVATTSPNVTISYTVGACSATQTVTVSANNAGTITGNFFTCTGTPTTLTETVSGGTWSINNSAFATVASVDATHGVVTGITESGISPIFITYTAPTGGCFKTLYSQIHIGAGTLSGGTTLCNGTSTLTLNPTVAGGSWTSSNPDLANVSSTGVVSGIVAGSLVITYAMPGGCETYQPVTVNSTPSAIIGYSYATATNYMAVGVGCTNILPGAQVFDSTYGGIWSTKYGYASIDGSTGAITGVSAGIDTVIYKIGSCRTASAFTVGSVNPAVIGGTASVCAGSTTVLTDATGGGKWYIALPYISPINLSSGTVIGVTAGTETVTYLVNGCYTTKVVTVNANTIPNVTGNANVCVGSTSQLANIGTGGSYIWSSPTPSLATVSAAGLVTGVAVGYPNIKYLDVTSGCFKLYGMSVNNTIPAAIGGATSICAGSTTTLTDVTASGVWTSDNTAVATVTVTGILTGVSAGSANINYVLNGCGVTTPVAFTVNSTPTAITGGLQVCAGNITALASSPALGTWSSSTTKATVDASGNVTGVTGNSTALISYTLAGCAATATVTVGTVPTAIGGSAIMCQGANITLTDVTDAYGYWNSSNLAIVNMGYYPSASLGLPYGTSTSGSIIGDGVGTATITFNTPGCTAVTKSITVNTVLPISGVFSVCNLATTALSDASGAGTWASSATTIATVDGSGNVTGVSVGTVTITFTGTASGCKATQAVYVSACTRSGNGNGGTTVADNTSVETYTLYPNPSTGNITIQQSIADDATLAVKVINYVGTTVYTGSVEFAGGKGQLNIQDVNSGMYLIQLVNNKGELQSFKMVIEK